MYSTGRKPSVDLDTLRSMLERYQDEDQPSIEALAEEFGQCAATVRKYLKLSLGSLPRGRAATMERAPFNVDAALNRVPTAELLGRGRCELLMRRRAEGASYQALAEEFGISRDRVTKLVHAAG